MSHAHHNETSPISIQGSNVTINQYSGPAGPDAPAIGGFSYNASNGDMSRLMEASKQLEQGGHLKEGTHFIIPEGAAQAALTQQSVANDAVHDQQPLGDFTARLQQEKAQQTQGTGGPSPA